MLAIRAKLGGLDKVAGDFVMQLLSISESHISGRVKISRAENIGIFDRQPSLERAVCRAVVALIGI